MTETTKKAAPQLTDIRQLGDTVEEIVEALKDPEVFEAIFGEPTDEEIAAALREAEAEYKAGDYQPTPLAADDEPYRQPTRQEILAGIKQGFKEALAGDTRPIQDLFDELENS
jgi:hypothetical protein